MKPPFFLFCFLCVTHTIHGMFPNHPEEAPDAKTIWITAAAVTAYTMIMCGSIYYFCLRKLCNEASDYEAKETEPLLSLRPVDNRENGKPTTENNDNHNFPGKEKENYATVVPTE